jgi:hypothetical protein
MAGVALSSLRVSLDGDSSGYVRAATAKVDADSRMIASDKAFAASQAQIAMALIESGRRLGNYADALNDNRANNVEASRGFALTGIETANLANHLKTAAVAAYALSPAFRGLVNPAITASFRAMGPAAVSAGGAALSALSPLIATVSRLALPITIAVESFRAMAAITELGAQKIAEFNELASKAGAAGVGTDFFQRQSAGAKEFGIDANLATDALKKSTTQRANSLAAARSTSAWTNSPRPATSKAIPASRHFSKQPIRKVNIGPRST